MKKLLCILLLVPFTAAFLSARDDDRKDVRSGNRKFDKGEFKEAVVDYQKALLRDSSSFAAAYDLANSLYRMENFNEARAVLDTIAEQAPLSGHASDYYYNTGNVALSLKDYQAAVDAYRSALMENPGDLDAKENYIYARKKLEEQQNNQNNQGQDNKDNQNNQDNQDNKDKQDNQDNQDNRENQDNRNDGGDNGGNQNQQNDDRSRPDSGEQPQSRPQISKQAAQQMLNAIMAKEKETQDKVKKEKAAVMQSKQREKNW